MTAARALFVEKGFAATATPEVVERAGVTRGALYHHFRDKTALFRAVAETEAALIAAEIDRNPVSPTSATEALLSGAKAYFQAMRQPGRVRLLLVDGLAVLGPDEMRRIDLETGGRELREGLQGALGAQATTVEIEACADLLSAMFDRAALACHAAADSAAYETTMETLLSILVRERLRGRPASRS